MIIIRLMWWLGNQLFQYALWKSLSVRHNCELVIDTDYSHACKDYRMHYSLYPFNIDDPIAKRNQLPWYIRTFSNKYLNILRFPLGFIAKKLNPHHIIENTRHPLIHRSMFDFQDKVFSYKPNPYLYLEWFWQSEKYFIWISKIIRNNFTLKNPLQDQQNLDMIKKMKWTNSISIHVRRNDYVSIDFQLCDMEYYTKAINYIKKKVKNPTFFVFSDDLKRCKGNFKNYNFENFIDWNTWKDSYKDMILMSECKHNIIANSTFSRRWAWLNNNPNKIVIAPKKWHKNLDYKDTIPSSWIKF